MKKLEKIIKEAILEVINEDTSLDQAAKAAELNALNKKIQALNAQKSAVASGKDEVTEMARISIKYKIGDLSKLDDLSDKVKNSKGVTGIIDYLQANEEASVAASTNNRFPVCLIDFALNVKAHTSQIVRSVNKFSCINS